MAAKKKTSSEREKEQQEAVDSHNRKAQEAYAAAVEAYKDLEFKGTSESLSYAASTLTETHYFIQASMVIRSGQKHMRLEPIKPQVIDRYHNPSPPDYPSPDYLKGLVTGLVTSHGALDYAKKMLDKARDEAANPRMTMYPLPFHPFHPGRF